MKKGFTAGNFDILHPGYIQLFKECKANCDHFTILLQTDPSIERPEKLAPILSTEERIEQLMSNIYIDEVLVYTYEKELLALIQKNKFDIRFLGDDYVENPILETNLASQFILSVAITAGVQPNSKILLQKVLKTEVN